MTDAAHAGHESTSDRAGHHLRIVPGAAWQSLIQSQLPHATSIDFCLRRPCFLVVSGRPHVVSVNDLAAISRVRVRSFSARRAIFFAERSRGFTTRSFVPAARYSAR
jgi:hypothetical protein